MKTNVAIIGAGPAGLTAAYLLSKNNVPVTVLEADPVYVGGISKTATYKGFHFDIGGHRFFSKSKAVEDFWMEILPNDMLDRPRSSRIFYGGKFFAYPVKNPNNFEDWVSNQFGKRLFNTFFKSYTEKVWGMSCKDISADWAAQRIKGLALGTAIRNALLPRRKPKQKSRMIKTLIDSFRYPRKGPGMIWEACARRVRELGGNVRMGEKVVGCSYDAGCREWTLTHVDRAGRRQETRAAHLISSAPLRELALGITPRLEEATRAAAERLRYRDFLTVVLILKDRSEEHTS